MELITVPRLRIGELQALTENALKICKPLAELKEEATIVEANLKQLTASIMKEKASSADRQELDRTRDKLITGLFLCLQSDSCYPYADDQKAELAEKLLELDKKYGLKIKRIPMGEETATIDNLLSELNTIGAKALEQSGANRWINLLKKANEEFKTSDLSYIASKASSATIEAPTIVAPVLSDSIERLCLKVFSYAQVSKNEAYTKAYAELTQLVESYR